jgi:outer membrane lipoprotein SlyB
MLKALLLTSAIFLSACASPPPAEMQARYGRVERIEFVTVEGDKKFGIGAVVGAIAGGVLGHQVGGGTGKAVATAAGAVAGGVIGNKVENRNDRRDGQYVVVKLQSGESIGVTQPADPNLRLGDRVRIDGAGEGVRLVRY